MNTDRWDFWPFGEMLLLRKASLLSRSVASFLCQKPPVWAIMPKLAYPRGWHLARLCPHWLKRSFGHHQERSYHDNENLQSETLDPVQPSLGNILSSDAFDIQNESRSCWGKVILELSGAAETMVASISAFVTPPPPKPDEKPKSPEALSLRSEWDLSQRLSE